MAKINRILWIAAAALVSASAMAPAAWAGCGDVALKKHAAFRATPDVGGMLMDAVLSGADRGGRLMPVDVVFPGRRDIVGMWNVTFLAGGNTIDFGYQVWHSDGTEIMNSGGRAPATENFCMGVWAQTGLRSYKLNHFALSYDAGTGAMNARVNIKENVVLDARGNSFSGPFTFDIYDPSGKTLVNHLAGQITGQRITVN